jgi:hypothetical protein
VAGEFDYARQIIAQAMQSATADPRMSTDVMASALLQSVIAQMLETRTRKDMASLIEFQLESCGEEEFVITRGC